MKLTYLPTLNALLNLTSTVLIVMGLRLIKKGQREAHKRAMLGAVLTSTAFLVGYLYYHHHMGVTRFAHQGWIRTAYMTILASHTVLAAAVPFLVLVSVVRALRSEFEIHKKWARLTAPIWIYVSVTGVVIYAMLYHL